VNCRASHTRTPFRQGQYLGKNRHLLGPIAP
jgi:hypothetical protein